jgi:hypothetical protein
MERMYMAMERLVVPRSGYGTCPAMRLHAGALLYGEPRFT